MSYNMINQHSWADEFWPAAFPLSKNLYATPLWCSVSVHNSTQCGQILEKIDNIEVVELGSKDIVRDEMVTKIINAYDSYDDQIKDLFDKSS